MTNHLRKIYFTFLMNKISNQKNNLINKIQNNCLNNDILNNNTKSDLEMILEKEILTHKEQKLKSFLNKN